MTQETWKKLDYYTSEKINCKIVGHFEVSNFGGCRYKNNNGVYRYIKPQVTSSEPRPRIDFLRSGVSWGDGKRHYVFLKRLVALAFIDNPDGLRNVGQYDKEPGNVNVDNLYWKN
ncbi:endonuclease [Lactococcus petauri]|uniref:endonuclease n=1 Tax=Lactococcus petauri TaxID=1940789 RepID=UPI0038533CB5